jgi:putative ABC transport system substrate-binding protein
MYPYRAFAEAGGLISYAPNDRDVFSRAASYVDRILKGANPGDLRPLLGVNRTSGEAAAS